MKNFKELTAQLAEAQVSTRKYSWGTMKTVHHGSDFSIPLHPEHHKEIAKLKDEQEHHFKTEDGKSWTARRKGDEVHFQGANNGGKTKVPHATMMEAKDEQEYGYEGDMAMNQLKTLVRCAEMIEDCLKPDTDLPEWVQSKITLATDYIQTAADYLYSESEVKEGYYEKPASAYRRKGDEIGGGSSKAPVAPVPPKKKEQMKSRVGHPTNEEVELSENAPFKKLEHAVAYATDKVKTHRDNLDGIEVYKHKSGGYDVNHTMNASGRNSLNKIGAKHLGTVYKDKPTNIKEEELKEYSMDDLHKDAAARLKKDIDTASDKRIADLKTPKKKEGFFHMVGRKQIAAVKGAIKGFKEQAELNEVNHRDYACAGCMHPDMAKHMKVGQEMDFYHSKTGDKISGVVKHNSDGQVHIGANKNGKLGAGEMHKFKVTNKLEEARLFASHQEASAAAKPGQKPKLDPNTNKYVLVSENKGLDVSKVAHAGDKPHEEEWVDAKKKKETPPFDPDPKSSFKKAKNPNRTGMDAAKALAMRGMKEDKEEGTMKTYNEFLQSLEEKLIGKQKKLDKNHNGDLDSQDFKMLRKEEAEELDEIKLADLPRRTVKGTSYGAQYHDPEGDDDADDKKPAKAADAPKRGRGRPAGAMSGARQKGSAKQSKTGGVDYTGYKLHLPNSNK